jgi:hypothetical protein
MRDGGMIDEVISSAFMYLIFGGLWILLHVPEWASYELL